MKTKRVLGKSSNTDSASISATENNTLTGSKKVTEVGPAFQLPPGAASVTPRDASTAVTQYPLGANLMIYNNSASVAWIGMAPLSADVPAAPGPTNAIPLKPADWTRISLGLNHFVKTSAATALIYILDDQTNLNIETVE